MKCPKCKTRVYRGNHTHVCWTCKNEWYAEDQIEQLEAENQRLREALEVSRRVIAMHEGVLIRLKDQLETGAMSIEIMESILDYIESALQKSEAARVALSGEQPK